MIGQCTAASLPAENPSHISFKSLFSRLVHQNHTSLVAIDGFNGAFNLESHYEAIYASLTLFSKSLFLRTSLNTPSTMHKPTLVDRTAL